MEEHDAHEGLSRAIAQITAAVTNASLYSFAHPQVGQYIEKAHAALTAALRLRPELSLLLIDGDLVAEKKPLPSGSAYVANFIRIMKKRGLEHITFCSGLAREELQDFIKDLAAPGALPVRSQNCIRLGKVDIRVRQAVSRTAAPLTTGGTAPDAEQLKELQALTAAELEELKELYIRVRKHRQIDVRGIDEMVKGFIQGFRKELNPLSILASLKSSHEYTFTHVTNVGILTMSQAESLGFTGEQLHQIGVASLLHDIGKIFVPEEILSKPGKLSQDERTIIETHTTKGARYLMGLDGIPKLAVLAALEHHLKFDGTGYPTIQGGWTPNIVSQMISIADVFDAMRSTRSYQEGQPMEKIEQVLRGGSGKSFNPKLVDHFLKIVTK